MEKPANIYLIGMMGSGKTSTGRSLSKLLRYSFVDLDEELELRENQRIPDLFRDKGESYFREAEVRVLASVSGGSMQVVSTGGGIILNAENARRMKATGRVVYLKTSLEHLLKRLEGSSNRPLLAGPDWKKRVAEILQSREAAYESAATMITVTNGKSAARVAEEIAEGLKQ